MTSGGPRRTREPHPDPYQLDGEHYRVIATIPEPARVRIPRSVHSRWTGATSSANSSRRIGIADPTAAYLWLLGVRESLGVGVDLLLYSEATRGCTQ